MPCASRNGLRNARISTAVADGLEPPATIVSIRGSDSEESEQLGPSGEDSAVRETIGAIDFQSNRAMVPAACRRVHVKSRRVFPELGKPVHLPSKSGEHLRRGHTRRAQGKDHERLKGHQPDQLLRWQFGWHLLPVRPLATPIELVWKVLVVPMAWCSACSRHRKCKSSMHRDVEVPRFKLITEPDDPLPHSRLRLIKAPHRRLPLAA